MARRRLPSPDRRPGQAPTVWQVLVHYLRLDASYATAWWRALGAARWTCATEWRRKLWFFHQRPGTVDIDGVCRFFDHSLSPAEVMAVVEALRHEGRLSGPQARVIEEQILSRTRADGRWM